MVEAQGLTKKYGGKPVVNQVSFRVEPGEIFGYLGKNGTGKSTTINMFAGIVRPTAGKALLFGKDVWKQPSVLYQKVGVLPDSSNYYSELTAWDHMRFFAEIKKVKVGKPHISELLERVGLTGHEKKKVGTFSLGMKKKLGLAQALLGDPELLFLDEPTSTLDPESAIQVRQLIVSLAKEGKTIFMTSHNLDEVEKICHRVAIMDQGNIVKMGTIRELKEKHQSAVRVRLITQQEDQASEVFCRQLNSLGISVTKEENGFLLTMDSDQLFPEVLTIAVHTGIRIYRVSFEEQSLEQIFVGV